MMTPEVDQWLTRFAAGAGTLFEWTFDPRVRWSNRLYACAMDGHGMCPLSAEATLETGTFYSLGDPLQAGERQGLTLPTIMALMNAADEEREADPEIRARLLRICRLTERGKTVSNSSDEMSIQRSDRMADEHFSVPEHILPMQHVVTDEDIFLRILSHYLEQGMTPADAEQQTREDIQRRLEGK